MCKVTLRTADQDVELVKRVEAGLFAQVRIKSGRRRAPTLTQDWNASWSTAPWPTTSSEANLRHRADQRHTRRGWRFWT